MIRLSLVIAVAVMAITNISFFKLSHAGGLPIEGLADIIEKASPAIVYIEEHRKQDKLTSTLPKDAEIPFINEGKTTGHGSGFLVSNTGYIITNRHVINDMNKISVIVHDHEEYVASVEAIDKYNDYALLKIDVQDLPFLKLENTEKIRTGDWAIALGFPFRGGLTATFGIISATGITQPGSSYYNKYLQTDAFFTPGFSGGPLLNVEGKVIGINSATFADGRENHGMGLALAISTIVESEVFKRYKSIFE